MRDDWLELEPLKGGLMDKHKLKRARQKVNLFWGLRRKWFDITQHGMTPPVPLPVPLWRVQERK